MKITAVSVGFILMSACTSGLFADEATEQVDKAEVLQLQVELRNAAQAEESYFATNGTYTTDTTALNLNPDPKITFVIPFASTTNYCIQATHSGLAEGGVWHISKTDPQAVEGAC